MSRAGGRPSATVTCPHCFSKHDPRNLLRSCSPVCPRDPGGATHTFPPTALTTNGMCPHGLRPRALRLCPSCLEPLPSEYLETQRRLVAFVGATSAGKSTYAGVLIHQLKGDVGARLDLAADLIGETSRVEYQRLRDSLFRSGRTPPPTPPAQRRRPEPLMLALRRRVHHRFPPHESTSTALLVLYDTAGEDVTSEVGVEFIDGYLGAASAVLVMIDAPALLNADDRDVALEPLHVVRQHLREVGARATPIAVVFTKIDQLLADAHFGPASPFHRPPGHTGADGADAADVHQELRSWLHAIGLGEEDRVLRTAVDRVRYFGVSALGHAPLDGRTVGDSGIRPYRVEDPVLWLLDDVPLGGGGRT